MVSSEVQRTLVKSPPELWAELSDPDSLARHLGELGEIEITRTVPEKLVEWEATGITGRVAIKASGWGTRVTLTVERELPAEAESESIEGRSDAVEEYAASESETVEPADDAGPPADDADPPAEAQAVEEPTSAEPSDASEPKAPPPQPAKTESAPPLEPRDEAPLRPPPATEAARSGAGWATTEHEHGVTQPPRTPDPIAEEPEDAAASDSPPAPEQRRGFFARLFGGRRKRVEQAPEPAAAAETGEAAREDQSIDALAAPAPPAAEPAIPTTPELLVAAETEHTGAEAEDEPGAAASETGHTTAAETAAEPISTSAAEPAPADAVPDPATEPGSAQDDRGKQAEPSLVATDIAAELKAAEESAAAEVTAILTGVLDRLGAAHHRPFSRA